MKNLIVALFCFLIILSIWFCVNYIFLDDVINQYNTDLDKLTNLVLKEDFSDCVIKVNDMLNNWKDVEKMWVYFVHQSDVDNIKQSLLDLSYCVLTRDKILSLLKIENIKSQLRRVKGNESLTLENIF